MQISKIKKVMDVAQGKAEADLIIKKAQVVNVFTKEIEELDVAVAEGKIAWLGLDDLNRTAKKVYDAKGHYLIPGLIDAHSHIEMSFMTPIPYAKTVLGHGTTAAILDMHDVCNAGINCMHSFAREIAQTPLKAFLMIPPCVPGTPKLEEAGANMTLADVKEAMNLPSTWGIAETMDFNRVLDREEVLLSILAWAREKGLRIDGHAPGLVGNDLQAYIANGILSDHESISLEEMLEKYRLGMKVILRRGSLEEPVRAGDFIDALADTSNVLLSTDGCLFIDDLIEKGHMNWALQAIVSEGVDPITAVQMATINVARAYGFDHMMGAIAPGRAADMVIVGDLKDFAVSAVFVDGQEFDPDVEIGTYFHPAGVLNTISLGEVEASVFAIEAPIKEGEVQVRVMSLLDGTVIAEEEHETMLVEGGKLQIDTSKDLLKVAVFDRYREKGNHAAGIVRGFGLKKGAFGGSVGQDSMNLVVVGTNDEDMALVVNQVREMQGGLVFAVDGQVISVVKLPVAGILSNIEPKELQGQFRKLHQDLADMGSRQLNPSFNLSLLLTCAVIPELKITNRGLVDAISGQFVPLFL
ncbi:MAG TPA: adenine deaminase [Syntrophomonadaceae bacterium]|nr:adenine deaminase [Syntrophomonadaceae bacterium]